MNKEEDSRVIRIQDSTKTLNMVVIWTRTITDSKTIGIKIKITDIKIKIIVTKIKISFKIKINIKIKIIKISILEGIKTITDKAMIDIKITDTRIIDNLIIEDHRNKIDFLKIDSNQIEISNQCKKCLNSEEIERFSNNWAELHKTHKSSNTSILSSALKIVIFNQLQVEDIILAKFLIWFLLCNREKRTSKVANLCISMEENDRIRFVLFLSVKVTKEKFYFTEIVQIRFPLIIDSLESTILLAIEDLTRPETLKTLWEILSSMIEVLSIVEILEA